MAKGRCAWECRARYGHAGQGMGGRVWSTYGPRHRKHNYILQKVLKFTTNSYDFISERTIREVKIWHVMPIVGWVGLVKWPRGKVTSRPMPRILNLHGSTYRPSQSSLWCQNYKEGLWQLPNSSHSLKTGLRGGRDRIANSLRNRALSEGTDSGEAGHDCLNLNFRHNFP